MIHISNDYLMYDDVCMEHDQASLVLDGKFVAAASHDNMLDIYSVKRGKKCATCTGNSSYLTHFDWDKRGKIL